MRTPRDLYPMLCTLPIIYINTYSFIYFTGDAKALAFDGSVGTKIPLERFPEQRNSSFLERFFLDGKPGNHSARAHAFATVSSVLLAAVGESIFYLLISLLGGRHG